MPTDLICLFHTSIYRGERSDPVEVGVSLSETEAVAELVNRVLPEHPGPEAEAAYLSIRRVWKK